MSNSDRVSGTVQLTFEADGYDVTVDVPKQTIAREIGRLEDRHPDEINQHGAAFLNRNVSKYVTVDVEPTREKWEELAGMEP